VAPLVSRDVPLLRLRDVTKTFPNGTVALRGVDLDIYPGEIHGLLGANGAGKSTLIKILSGALERDGGTVEFDRMPVSWQSPKEAVGVATVYQHTPLVPTLSVLENVFLGREGRAFVDRRQQRANLQEIFERVGWETDPDELVGDLPLGQHKMIALLQALARRARLVILDEPTAALDSHTGRNVMEMMSDLAHKRGRAVVIVTHDSRVLDFADRIVRIEDGAIARPSEAEPVPAGLLVHGMGAGAVSFA